MSLNIRLVVLPDGRVQIVFGRVPSTVYSSWRHYLANGIWEYAACDVLRVSASAVTPLRQRRAVSHA